MVTVNGQLRAARERSASSSSPGVCLSRQELAELVNDYVWDHYHKRREWDGNYLGKLERGVIRWPNMLCREALRVILSVSTDAALGFANPRSAVVKLVDVDRKLDRRTATLGLGGLAMGAFAPAAALLEGDEPAAVPVRVGATEIAQIRGAGQVFESWCVTYGGGLAREVVRAQLRYSAGLLEATCPARLRPDLFSAVGDLADVAGFMAFDAYAHAEARRVLRFALGCAEEVGDWHLRAEILGSMAVQAIWTGRPDDGLTLAEQGLVRADRLTATERAMLHTYRAWALAKMRRVRETLAAVGTADDHFAHSAPVNDPSFVAYYDANMHAGTTGQALADLAPAGHSATEAAARLSTAIAGHGPAIARSKVMSQVTLACLTMATGDPVQATSASRQWTRRRRCARPASSTRCANSPATPPATPESTRSPRWASASPRSWLPEPALNAGTTRDLRVAHG